MTGVSAQGVVQKALARLDQGLDVHANEPERTTSLSKPLAALIRQNRNPIYCSCRTTHEAKKIVHAPDCALIALCKAIGGEG